MVFTYYILTSRELEYLSLAVLKCKNKKLQLNCLSVILPLKRLLKLFFVNFPHEIKLMQPLSPFLGIF